MAHALLLIRKMNGRVGSRAHARRRRVARLLLLATLALAVGSRPVLAQQPASVPSAQVTRLEAECARLRVELARVNAEVAALKRSGRGVRGDRLRDRMADAEALARQLTRAETELRGRTGRPAAAPAIPTPAPAAAPGDGPVELEAKADLLVDEAHRLNDQAAALSRKASQLRGRQALRRRAADLDRDPFASLDAPKRTMVFGGAARATETDSNTTAPVAPPSPPPTGTRSAPGIAVAGTTNTPTSAPPPTAPPTDSVAPPQPTAAIPAPIRTLLDPATISEIQRLERASRAPSDPDALEKMASVLRQRAQALEAQARSVRPHAK
jgi:hypothetical protein